MFINDFLKEIKGMVYCITNLPVMAWVQSTFITSKKGIDINISF